ncbi:MAG: hypothetical protein ABJN35_12365 [Erythrobacter sp.]
MNKPSRRAAMGAFVAFGSAAALGLGPHTLFARSGLAIPPRPMRLFRRLERSLRGGASLSIERNWRIEFGYSADHGADGASTISITGTQIDVAVDAPESLAALTAIERSRPTDQMWPIMLTSVGRIYAAGNGTRAADIAAAVDEARRMIEQRDIPDDERAAHQAYLMQMQRAGASLLDRMPGDLFYPSEEPRRSSQQINLPNGGVGQFEVLYTARCSTQGAWLAQADREVVTRIGQSESRAKEQWTLVEF